MTGSWIPTSLYFLAGGSDSAIAHWKKEGRLEDGERGMYLTRDGLAECARSLAGQTRGYNTSEGKVSEWVERMLTGDHVTTATYNVQRS